MRPILPSILTRAIQMGAVLIALSAAGPAPAAALVPSGVPEATIDLTTMQGADLVGGAWRYSDANLLEVDFRSAGPDLKPSGRPNRAMDLLPRAGAADFDDSGWSVIEPEGLAARRSNGRVSFNWYRIKVTLPGRVGDFDTTGSTAVFETVVDDYAEVWVDGALPRELGGDNPNLVQGWNQPNRVVIAPDVKPGQQVQIAVFGANGPISDPPANYIWVRSAKIRFYKPARAIVTEEARRAGGAGGTIDRLDPALDAIVPPGARIEKLAEGFKFIEGPVWVHDGGAGHLLFSGPNGNVIYKWSEAGGLSVVRENSGYSGADIDEYGQPGSNGLTLDRQGRLTLCEHGNHRISRIEKDGSLTVLADSFEGKRLNSPNDLVYRSDGTLYFTDPPFGLPRFFDDPRKELPFSGIFLLKDGALKLLDKELTGPNGLAFSPDEKHLYVDNWDANRKVVMRYDVLPDGRLTGGKVFFDMKAAPEPEALDGLKVDRKGNLYVSGPGGVWILSPAGKHLGTIKAPELAANFAWGDADGRTLYLAARGGLYRVRLGATGIRP